MEGDKTLVAWIIAFIFIYVIALSRVNCFIYDLTTHILFITFLTLFWYSFETKKIHLLNKKQFSLQIRPIITIDDSELRDKKIVLKNIGSGSALNVVIQDIHIGGLGTVAKFEQINCLEPRETKSSKVVFFNGDVESRWCFEANLMESYASGTYELLIRYENVMNEKFQQSFLLGENKVLSIKVDEPNG